MGCQGRGRDTLFLKLRLPLNQFDVAFMLGPWRECLSHFIQLGQDKALASADTMGKIFGFEVYLQIETLERETNNYEGKYASIV